MQKSTPLLLLVGLLVAQASSFGQNPELPLITQGNQVAQPSVFPLNKEELRQVARLERKARQENDPLLLADAYFEYGALYCTAGDYTKFKFYLLKSLRILEPRGDSFQLGRVYLRLSENFRAIPHTPEERQYARRALGVFQRIGSKMGLMLAYQTIGQLSQIPSNTSSVSNELDSAVYYFKMVERMAKQLRDTMRLGDAAVNLGAYYLSHHEPDKAIQYLEEACRYYNGPERSKARLDAMISLGCAYQEAGQMQRGYDTIVSARQMHENHSPKDHQAALKLDHALIAHYRKTGNWRRAFDQLLGMYNRGNLNYAAKRDGDLVRFQVAYNTQKKELQLRARETELALTNENLRQQRLFVLVVSVLFLAAAILSVLFFRLYRSYQRTSQQNEYLVRELSHRSRNNLQRIMSLLGMQGRLLADPISKQAIEESRLRIQSMSLIQNRLYDEESTHTFDLADLIPELTENVLHACGYDHLTPDYDLATVTLDTDRAVSLGLILTELVTNACKHAFPLTPRPAITISCFQKNQMTTFTLADNGPGRAPEVGVPAADGSLGLALIQLQVEQLRGQYTFTYEKGTRFTLNFKNPLS